MSPISQAGFRALVVLLSIVLLYVTYGYFNFYRDPLSIFFSEKHGFDRFYSAARQAEADAFLDMLDANPDIVRSRLAKAGPQPEMCAVFMTIARDMDGRQYVETALGSSLANMSRAEREAIHLKVFFADVPSPETQHKSYSGLAAADIVDELVTYPGTLPDKDREREMALLESWFENRSVKSKVERKTLYDYAYALRRCIQTTEAPYIALFEDDILLADGWAARTLKNLHTVEEMMKDPRRHNPKRGQVKPGGPNSWLYLRMFNQERSSGWGGGYGFRSNNAHIISLGVAIPVLASILLARRFFFPRSLSRHIDGWVLLIVCGVAIPLFVWLFFASGKASLLGPSPGVYEEWFGCCSQALVFNRKHAQALSNFFMAATTKPGKPGRGDMLPKDFAWDHGLARLSAYPMLAQHLGRISATGTTSLEAGRIWSMAFEDLRAHQLAADHVRDVAELFGQEAVREMMLHR
ncbi:putative integral membrane protein [Rosellinia necatrix]|uniref:Putative integral membrane protein n=1 Tax=Rosellinia necatrix TaxID=77044 RepID=A0A1S7UL12_ROSNE|nr:putative integral membrane protein [Rosellinia necatrix]